MQLFPGQSPELESLMDRHDSLAPEANKIMDTLKEDPTRTFSVDVTGEELKDMISVLGKQVETVGIETAKAEYLYHLTAQAGQLDQVTLDADEILKLARANMERLVNLAAGLIAAAVVQTMPAGAE